MHKESVEGYQDLEIDIWQLNQNELQISQWTQDCLDEINWIAGVIKMFGKEHKIPRLQAWYADKDINYSYSGKILIRNNWNAILKEIKDHIELITLGKFNSVLANLYRDGNDSMGMHADDEKELGQKPIIVSLSLGEKRDLFFKHKYKNIYDFFLNKL